MAQQSIFGRIGQLMRANVNALIDNAEDPEKMLDQMIRDYSSNIQEAEVAIAQTIGNLRMLEDDSREAQQTSSEWGGKALAASTRADQLRAGSPTEADKFDKLARVALQRQLDAERQVTTFAPNIAQQTEIVDKLKDGLQGMKGKLGELHTKRDQLVARAKMADAQSKVHDAIKSVNILDPTSEVARFEDKIRREEAKVRGQAELAASSLDAQFEDLDDVADQLEIDQRLAALKAPAAPPPALGAGETSES